MPFPSGSGPKLSRTVSPAIATHHERSSEVQRRQVEAVVQTSHEKLTARRSKFRKRISGIRCFVLPTSRSCVADAATSLFANNLTTEPGRPQRCPPDSQQRFRILVPGTKLARSWHEVGERIRPSRALNRARHDIDDASVDRRARAVNALRRAGHSGNWEIGTWQSVDRVTASLTLDL